MSELARHVWTALRLEPDPRRGSFPTAELPFHPDSGWTEVAGQLAALSVALRAHQLEQAAV
jgi:hypothetical protein